MEEKFFIFDATDGEILEVDTEEAVIAWLNTLIEFEIESVTIVRGVKMKIKLGITEQDE